MNIIIVGCGKIGSTILESLATENHDIVAVDTNPKVITDISNLYDVMCLCGNGVDFETLEEAGAKKTNLLIAVTGSDECNMLICYMARKLGVPYTIARIRNPEYNDKSLGFIKQSLDISFAVNPDAVAAKELFNLLQFPGAESIETFSRRNFELIEVVLKEGSVLDGMSLIEMRKKYPASYLVGIVQRGDEVYIPGGSFRLQSGDRVGITASASEIEKLFKMLGTMEDRAKHVMIVGAGRYAHYLTKHLLSTGATVTVIDKDKSICQSFAEANPEAVVICGDAASEELLMEEGLMSMDAFITLTGHDQENILLSYLASSKGVKKVITKINREEFYSMAEKLGLECLVSPKHMVCDILTRYARALAGSEGSQVETLYNLMGGKAEAIEFIVGEDFSRKSIPLKDLKLKKNTLVAGIIRGRRVIIPAGSDQIEAGDHVVILSSSKRVSQLGDILE
ncbi:MAG: Trk system potassium transporter TrkA [Ruminococcaceae bacterium]|nr:Trk system potassium transporter TrkA [Oscillospiraceae bacterium]